MSPSPRLAPQSRRPEGWPHGTSRTRLFRIRWPITPPVDVSYNHLMAKYERELETEKEHQSRSLAPGPLSAIRRMPPENDAEMFRLETKKKTGDVRARGHHPPVFLAVMTSQSTFVLLFC